MSSQTREVLLNIAGLVSMMSFILLSVIVMSDAAESEADGEREIQAGPAVQILFGLFLISTIICAINAMGAG